MIWHHFFGVESGIDALLSPTHLALFAGGALLFSGPIRASRMRGEASIPWAAPSAILAVTAIAAVAAFALIYLSGFLSDEPTFAVSQAPEGTADHITGEALASAGLASYLVTSLVIVIPLTFLIRQRLALPGAATFLVLSLALLACVLEDFRKPGIIIAAAVAGVLADLALYALARHGSSVRERELLMSALVPLLLWSGQLLALAAQGPILWSLEMVTGVVIVSAGMSFAAVFVLRFAWSDPAQTSEKAAGQGTAGKKLNGR